MGSLVYLPIATRPDITYAVSNVAKFCDKPTKQHWVACLKCVFQYLQGTQQYGLLYSKSDSNHCVGFSDADWGKKQTCVARSKHVWPYQLLRQSIASAAQESLILQQLLTNLKKEDLRSVTRQSVCNQHGKEPTVS